MSSSSVSDREEILALYDEWETINDKVVALSLDALTDTELLALQSRREVVARRQPVVDHQIINRLAAEADPKALGGKSLADVLATRLDISTAEAKRRIKYAELLGPRQAITAGGTLLPMSHVIRLASDSHHYLAVFDKHRSEALYLGHSKRFASTGQRIVLHARDRGCTRPGCTAPGYWCQAHHVEGWAAANGPTNVNKLTLACGPDNRLVEQGGWTTRKRKDGRIEWIPPPHLDTGQARVNNYHHPEKYLVDEEDDDDP